MLWWVFSRGGGGPSHPWTAASPDWENVSSSGQRSQLPHEETICSSLFNVSLLLKRWLCSYPFPGISVTFYYFPLTSTLAVWKVSAFWDSGDSTWVERPRKLKGVVWGEKSVDLFVRVTGTSLEYSDFGVMEPFPSLYKTEMIVKDPVVNDDETSSKTKC